MSRGTFWGLVALAISIAISVEVNAVMARHHRPSGEIFLLSFTLCMLCVLGFSWMAS